MAINITPAIGANVGTSLTISIIDTAGIGDGTWEITYEAQKTATGAPITGAWNSTHAGSVTGGHTFSAGIVFSLVSGTGYKFRFTATYTPTGAGTGFTHTSDWYTATAYATVTPVGSLVSPRGAVISTTPSIQLNYSTSGVGSVYGFGAYEVQVRDKASAGATLSYDTGWVTTTTAQKSARSAIFNYAGPTLSDDGTVYQIRGRPRDVWQSQQGDYTEWVDFTVGAAPALATGLTPTGLQTTLTPTIGGTFNIGTGDSMASWQYRIKANGITIYTSGAIDDELEDGGTFSQAYGTANGSDSPSTPPDLDWGMGDLVAEIQTTNASGVSSAWAPTSFSTKSKPTTPTNLSPNGSVISDTTPAFTGVHNDPENAALTQLKIWLHLASDDTAVTGYDPKVIDVGDLDSYDEDTGAWEHDSTETLTDSPATDYKWTAATQGDSAPGYGPQAPWKTFTVAAAPTISVTSPTDASDVTGLPVSTVYSITPASGTTLASHRRRLYAADGTTLLYDSGVDTDGAGESGEQDFTKDVSYTGWENGESYKLQITAVDSLGGTASSDLIEITVDWTPPATITGLTATPIGGNGSLLLPGVALHWDESEESAFEEYRIYRRVAGETAWNLLTSISAVATQDYADYLCGSGTLYDYAVTAVITTSGQLVEGDKPTAAQASVDFANVSFLHAVDAPGSFCALVLSSENSSTPGDATLVQPFLAEAPVAHFGAGWARKFTVSGVFSSLDELDVERDLRAVVRLQQTAGAQLCYRNDLGSVMFCSATEPSRRAAALQYQLSLTLQEVDYPPGAGLSS